MNNELKKKSSVLIKKDVDLCSKRISAQIVVVIFYKVTINYMGNSISSFCVSVYFHFYFSGGGRGLGFSSSSLQLLTIPYLIFTYAM